VLAHFPPADTYNAEANVAEIRKNVREYKDHDRSRHSLYLFGFGDGGGGPTREMLEVLLRVKDLQGMPRTSIDAPREFFDKLAADCADRPRMVSELHFEYHRGTYTSQAATKRNMRKSEFLLHDVEFIAAVAWHLGLHAYPQLELERLMQLVLLNQFHDILPGSSIREVYETADRQFADVFASGSTLRAAAADALVDGLTRGGGAASPHTTAEACSADAAVSAHATATALADPLIAANDGAAASVWVPINTLSFDRDELCENPDVQLVCVKAPSCGVGTVQAPTLSAVDSVSLRVDDSSGRIVLENANLRATFNAGGDLLSLHDKNAGREALAAAGNRLQLFEDFPLQYDAWEIEPYHLEQVRDCPAAESYEIVCSGGPRAELAFNRRLGAHSSMRQVVRLDANSRRLEFHCRADWHESHKLLKVLFPVAVRAMHATYEMQFGCIERPTHYNTTYDLAQFEVPGHKWVDLSEH
jgi:alpha-mannosidase